MTTPPDARVEVAGAGAAAAAAGAAAAPTHHLPEKVLLSYVAGDLGGPVALAAACHLTLCPRCRTQAHALERGAGALFDRGAAAPVDGSLLARTLARLEPLGAGAGAGAGAGGSLPRPANGVHGHGRGAAAPSPPAPPAAAAAQAPHVPEILAGCGLPAPLLRALPRGDAFGWRFLAPGVKAMELDLGPGDRAGAVARLIKLRPGLDIPLHDHGGQELTLVFTGALEDAQGRFGRGDLSYRFPGSHHRQHVDAAGDCIALQVNEGRFLPLTLKGWLIRFVARE